MLERKHTINVPLRGTLPAKRADELKPGNVFYTPSGVRLKVVETKKLKDGKIEILVEHPIQEYEYYDNESTHYVKYSPGNMFGTEVD